MLALAAAFLPFAVSTSMSPGPNNLMLASSGATFGFRRTGPHMLGITAGFPAMVVAVGLGLGGVFTAFPQLHTAVKYLGAAYLLVLAWRIGTARAPTGGDADPAGGARSGGRPLTFMQAALFQWVNPKAWIMAVGSIATYTTVGGQVTAEVLVIAGVFGLVSLASTATWTVLGVGIARLLRGSERGLRAFNVAMALLLAASVIPFIQPG